MGHANLWQRIIKFVLDGPFLASYVREEFSGWISSFIGVEVLNWKLRTAPHQLSCWLVIICPSLQGIQASIACTLPPQYRSDRVHHDKSDITEELGYGQNIVSEFVYSRILSEYCTFKVLYSVEENLLNWRRLSRRQHCKGRASMIVLNRCLQISKFRTVWRWGRL